MEVTFFMSDALFVLTEAKCVFLNLTFFTSDAFLVLAEAKCVFFKI